MSRLLKIFFCLTLLFLLSFPALAADSCVAYRPESSALDSLIKEAQARGGAAALVPAPVIKAVYFIEALPYYAAGSFTCKKNQYTALGLWQIVDGEYHSTVPENQQLDNDEYVCQATNCKLSRCNAADAVEIFSRALLGKITLWDNTEDKPLGKIESIADIMYSTGRYYGLFVPDQYTNNLIEYLPQNQRYPSGHQNADTITYPEFICAKSGYCKTYQDYLDRNYLGSTYLDYSGKKSDVPFTFDACGLTTNISPSTTNPLRPNPFELVKEEKNRQISDPNLAPFCAFRPTVVQNTAAAISGTLSVDFRSFITPFLSAPGSTTAEKRYLADYLEGSVFNKLAPASYQDQLKNAMIARASGNADANTINQAYGFPTATTQIHDYEINAPSGKFKLSKLAPKPLDDPDALAIWLNSPTAQAWPYIPMFTREDSKGFIQSLPEPGQVSLPQVTEVIHPHLARTYEVSSTIANLLSPESTHQFQPPDLPINWVQPAPWTTDNNWLDSSQSVPAVFGPVCDPQEPTKVIAGPGEPARGGQITTAVSKSSVTVNPLISTRFSPIYLKTYTPFLDQIAFNLLTGPGALFGIFNLANEKPENWPAVGNDSQKAPAYSFTGGSAESGLKKPGKPAQYLYNYLGSLHCQKEKLIAGIQPFLTGQSYDLPPECGGGGDGGDGGGLSGLAGVCPEGGQEITAQLAGQMQNGREQFLPNTVTPRSEAGRLCITPTMIVIHWSGGWDNDQGNDATFGTLLQGDLACQLASDTNDTILMQPFYETQVEYPACAGVWNIHSINNELAGGYLPSPDEPEYGTVDIRFTDETGNPSRIGNPYKPSQTAFPEKSVVDHAVSATCAIMKQYNIPWAQIYGHYQVPNSGGKPDPGKEFLENWFIPRVKNECN